MSRLKTIIGILILFTYLCPFVSCEGPIAETPVLTAADSTAISDSILKANSEIAAGLKMDTSVIADSTAVIRDNALNADSGNITRLKMDSSAAGDTFSNTNTTNSTPLENNTEPQDEKNNFWGRLFFPTDKSISGLGELLSVGEKETANFLLVSFLLSIIIVLPLKTAHYKIGRVLIVAVNLACLIAYMYLSAVVDGERLLWGVWLLLLLVSVELVVELKYKPGVVKDNPGG